MEVHNEKSRRVSAGEERVNLNLDLVDRVHAIQSREDLAAFLRELSCILDQKPDGWENTDLKSFLDALPRWVQDMDGYYLDRGEPAPEAPS